ncbi:MAG: phosphoglycerate kinase [bacterium]|nr:phosphoglycerate kinase [bacterium]
MKKSIKDFDLNNKKVIIRCDFNVPIINEEISDDNRIIESLKTIKYAIDNNAKVILMSHLSKINSEEDKKNKSLGIVRDKLNNLLGKNILFSKDTRGAKLERIINNMKNKDVLLIENTRFEDYPENRESSNDEELSKYWASLGDIFINDAFGTLHRAHASNYGIGTYLPNGIGFLVEEELKKLSVLDNPDKPYVVILGGAKIKDKIKLIEKLIKKADKILIGGGMAYTFLKAQGYNIGNSICDDDSIAFSKKMIDKYSQKIVLPVDNKVTKKFEDTEENIIVNSDCIPDGYMGLDIGPKTIKIFENELKKAKTVFWNGTLGYSEFNNYSQGTKEILDYLSKLGIITILGGGDTVSASNKFGYKDKFTHESTGGGATLKLIAGEKMPSLEIIDELES